MKKRLNITLQIILIFACAIGMSFIGDSLHGFLGDFHCKGSGERIVDTYNMYTICNTRDLFSSGWHESTWHWGYRHYLFFFCGASLFIVQAVFLIRYIEKD